MEGEGGGGGEGGRDKGREIVKRIGIKKEMKRAEMTDGIERWEDTAIAMQRGR